LLVSAWVALVIEEDLDLEAAQADHVAVGKSVARHWSSSKAGAIGAPDVAHDAPAVLP
jgi:hypothetical protein